MSSSEDGQIQDPLDQPCYVHRSDEVDQIFANPQHFVHRMVTIRGTYFSGMEQSSLSTCANGHSVKLKLWGAFEVAALEKEKGW